jgi:MFS family permease
VLVATFVTYARVPAAELYHVSHEGLRGGFSRAVVDLNFPDAIIAIPVALLAVDVLGRSNAVVAATVVAIAACLVTALPGVVDRDDLDAKAVNAVPVVGVAIVVALLVKAWPRLGWASVRLPGDPLRLVLAVVIAIGAIPYGFAELGFYAPDPIRADEPTPGEDIASVHLGSHEGMDGALLAVAALLLTRVTPSFHGRRLAAATSTILALYLAYGVANLIQDDWHEQVVKRGWTDHGIASFVAPQLSWRWLIVIVVGIALELLWFRRERRAGG